MTKTHLYDHQRWDLGRWAFAVIRSCVTTRSSNTHLLVSSDEKLIVWLGWLCVRRWPKKTIIDSVPFPWPDSPSNVQFCLFRCWFESLKFFENWNQDARVKRCWTTWSRGEPVVSRLMGTSVWGIRRGIFTTTVLIDTTSWTHRAKPDKGAILPISRSPSFDWLDDCQAQAVLATHLWAEDGLLQSWRSARVVKIGGMNSYFLCCSLDKHEMFY